VAAGPTRRRRWRRVGPLLVTAALLAGLVTAPHVVLAAVQGPDTSTSQPTAKRCPEDRQDAKAAAERDRDEDEDWDDQREDHEEPETSTPATAPSPPPGDPAPGGEALGF
jgi:hypothetical protein